jgi:hypothetical protein
MKLDILSAHTRKPSGFRHLFRQAVWSVRRTDGTCQVNKAFAALLCLVMTMGAAPAARAVSLGKYK